MGSKHIKVFSEENSLRKVYEDLKPTRYSQNLNSIETEPLLVLKTFFHKNLDSYEGPLPNNLEGMTLLFSMTSFMDDLIAFVKQKHPDDKELQELTYSFARAYLIEDMLGVLSDYYLYNTERKVLAKEVDNIVETIKALIKDTPADGAPILIPGGMHRFVSEGGGHAFMYVINVYRDEKNQRKLRFEIINRGYGLSNHMMDFSDDNKEVFQSFIIDNIDPEAIEDGPLLNDLMSLKVFYERNEPILPILSYYVEKWNWSSGYAINRIYQMSKKELIEKGHGNLYLIEDNRFWHHEQRWGTCTMKVLMTWMRENVHPDMMKEFKYFVAERSTKKLREKLQNPSFRDEALGIFQTSSNYQYVQPDDDATNLLPMLLDEGESIKSKRAKKYSPRGIYKPGVL
jgi:hypothetical protein